MPQLGDAMVLAGHLLLRRFSRSRLLIWLWRIELRFIRGWLFRLWFAKPGFFKFLLACFLILRIELFQQQFILNQLPPRFPHLGIARGINRLFRIDNDFLVDGVIRFDFQELVNQNNALIDPLEQPVKHLVDKTDIPLFEHVVQVGFVLGQFVDIGLREINPKRIERFQDGGEGAFRNLIVQRHFGQMFA